MQVWFVDADGAHPRDPDDVVELFAHEDGFFWIDVPVWEDAAGDLLTGLGCHPLVLEGCRQRNYVPTVHGYDDHAFVTTQSPLLGSAGHVHLLELDQIIGHHFLVTVHGPVNPAVDIAEALVETDGPCWPGCEGGRFRPTYADRAVLRHHLGRRAPAERAGPRRWRPSSPASRRR